MCDKNNFHAVKIPLYGGLLIIMFTDNKNDVVDFFTNNSDLENAINAEDRSPFGTTYYTHHKGKRATLIVFNPLEEEWDPSVITHESIHFAERVLDFIGYTGIGEPFAYLAQWFVRFTYESAEKQNVKL